MKLRSKNPLTKGLIEELQAKGHRTPAWKAVAKGLNRPNRQSYEVNLTRLDKHVKKGEHVVVPGTVLGMGKISKPITVAALRVSGSARAAIEKAGGKVLTIEDMIKDNPHAKKLRIMG
jgi:large subunit ribosomal protein L18e